VRICFVTAEYPPATGGTGQSVSRIARGLATHTGHEVHVLWVDVWKEHDRQLRESPDGANCSVWAGQGSPAVHYVEPVASELDAPKLAFYRHLSRLATTIRFEVFVGLGLSWAGFPGGVLGKELGIPSVLSMHGSDRDLSRAARAHRAFPTHARWTLENAARVVSVSGKELELASALQDLDGRGAVIPNGVAPADFDQGVTARVSELDSSRIVVSTAAGFSRTKGLHVLLQAAEKMKENSFSVLVIGAPQVEAQDYFRRLCRRHANSASIVHIGLEPHRRILSFLRLADIFAPPSLSEGAPNVLLEAMLAGKAIVASDVGAEGDTIEDDVSGLIVPPGSVA
jgi:glycosyltransferase involved in cell wall biosynthesis